LAVIGLWCTVAVVLEADDVTARNPLIPPLFSLDPNSPEVTGGPFLAGDLLLPTGPNMPSVEIPAVNLGLLEPADNLNALALGACDVAPTDTFVVIFSVDRPAVGGVPPDPNLAALGFPFNVQDQATKNQAASDSFMSLRLFDRFGPIPPSPSSPTPRSSNNTLVINGGDAGGVDYRINPGGTSPASPNPGGQSDVDGGSGTSPPPPGARDGRSEFDLVYFTAADGSPSLVTLPGTGSAADIYVDPDTSDPLTELLYVEPTLIGLRPGDDVDGLIIFEGGDPLVFDPGVDQVVFSLTPESPSLNDIFGPGDLFTSEGFGFFSLYAQAFDLGLSPADNLNMLDYVRCEDVMACAHDWAIGYVEDPCPWDINDDGVVDLADLATLLSSYGLCAGDAGYVPEADLDGDECVGLADLATLLAHYGETCDG
jgi:hypothetical protein